MPSNLVNSVDQKKIEAIFYGAEVPMVIFNGPEMIFEMFNSKYQEIYPGRELLNKPLLEAVPELKDSPFPEILRKIYETGKPFVSHEGMVCIYNPTIAQSEDRYFDTTFSRITYGDGENYRILATPREVTDRVLAHKKLEESLFELKEERELREKFVSALSHDLRTPLAVAKMGAEYIKMDANEPAAVSSMAERISASLDRADRMIRNLLDANRMKVGANISLAFEACQLDSLINYIVDDLQKLHQERFQVENKAGRVSGFWDKLAIHRLIENLANNAIKYGNPDSKILITLNSKKDWVEIAVHNKGQAILKEDQKNLFNHYHRSVVAESSGQIGWGIGLTIVKGLAEAHGGSVRVESDEEFGTTFFVNLPLDARKKS